MQNIFFELLNDEKKKGTTIFYSTHILNEVSKICDRVGIIKEGKLIKIEKVNEIKNKHLTNITIESEDVEEIKKDLNIDAEINENKMSFKNELNSNELLKKLTKYNIKKILIEEPSLEDIFYHYYK